MSTVKIFFYTFLCLSIGGIAIAGVPASQFQKPSIPYYMQSMDFRSLRMKSFATYYSGMVDDKYADLILNPAFIDSITQSSFYIDFNNANASPFLNTPYQAAQAYSDNYFIRPGWYSSTSYNAMDTNPHYNFAMLLPVSKRIKIGLSHRLLFDYGPFLMEQTYNSWTHNNRYYDSDGAVTPNLMRLEVDENQQTIAGSQTELNLGINLSSKLDMGVRVGHYLYRQDGELFDSKWAYFPHNSFADLNDDNMKINGDQYETGLGLLYRVSEKFKVGIYAGYTAGDGDRNTAALDTSDYWNEQDTDTSYYSMNHAFLTSQNNADIESTKPQFNLFLEWQLKDDLKLRSSFSYTKLNTDFSGTIAAHDTSHSDRTYDDWDNGSIHFRREQTESFGQTSLIGSGDEESTKMSWFISLIYQPDENWTLFGGLHLQKLEYTYNIDESSINRQGSYSAYSIYKPETSRSAYFDDKQYTIQSSQDMFVGAVPIGLFAHIYKGFSLIIGTDIVMSLSEIKASSDLLYTTKTQQRWENERLIVDDQEENRLERFTSQEPKVFTRTTNNYFGFMYAHKSGANFYVKSAGDLFGSNTWAFGFELGL